MPEILSSDTHPTISPLKKGWRKFLSMEKFYRMALFSMFLLLIATPIIVTNRFDTRQRAESLPTTLTTTRAKGVNWHMGAWYAATTGISAYNYDGLKKDLNDMKNGNISWVRISMNKATQSSCSTTGFYTWTANELDSRGMKGLLTVSIPGATTTTASDAEVSAFTTWLSTMVNCYKTRYHDWEIGNEPNLHYFWNIDENTTDNAAYARSVGYYIKYLQAAYQTIKAIDPSANVMMGGLSQWKDERFMDEFTRLGGGAFVDSVAFHPYSDTGPQGSINELTVFKQKLSADTLLANKPIWITEVGFTTSANSGPGYVTSEQTKADYLRQTYELLASQGITTPIFWYDWDHDKCTNCGAGYGLIFTDRSTTAYQTTYFPAYETLKTLWAVQIPTSTPIATIIPTATPMTPTSTSIPFTPTPTRLPTSTPTLYPADATPPTVQIISPLNNAALPRGRAITITTSATDNVAVARVEFYANNQLISGCSDIVAPYSCSWNIPNKPNARYTLSAKAFDTASNQATNAIQVSVLK